MSAARAGVWPTLWAPLPIVESDRALEFAGTNGLAIYAALLKLRSIAPRENRGKFFASEEQISRFSGISARRLREPLRKLEENGVVTIHRPIGAARLAHQACQYTLNPIFTAGNKVNADRTKRPLRDGHELGSNLSDNRESPPTEGDESMGAGRRAPVGAPASASDSKEKRMSDEW